VINATHTTTATPAGDESRLVEQFARRADTDANGRVTSDELTRFLSDLMRSLDEELATEARTPAASSAPPTVDRVAMPSIDTIPMTPAQGTELLRRAFGSTERFR